MFIQWLAPPHLNYNPKRLQYIFLGYKIIFLNIYLSLLKIKKIFEH